MWVGVGSGAVNGAALALVPRYEIQILPDYKRTIDLRDGVRWLRDKEPADGKRIASAKPSATPAHSGRVGQHCWHKDIEVSATVYIEEGLFTAHRSRRQDSLWRLRQRLRWSALDARQDHVPAATIPSAQRTV